MERRDPPRAHDRAVHRVDTSLSRDARISGRCRGRYAKAECRAAGGALTPKLEFDSHSNLSRAMAAELGRAFGGDPAKCRAGKVKSRIAEVRMVRQVCEAP